MRDDPPETMFKVLATRRTREVVTLTLVIVGLVALIGGLFLFKLGLCPSGMAALECIRGY
jgi:hypothetical protein